MSRKYARVEPKLVPCIAVLLPLFTVLAPLVYAYGVATNDDAKSCREGMQWAEIDTADGGSYQAVPNWEPNSTGPNVDRVEHREGGNFLNHASPMCSELGELMSYHCPRQKEGIFESSDSTVWISPEQRFGAKQRSFGTEEEEARMRAYLEDVIHYMDKEVFTKPEFATVRENNECRNRDERCTHWAAEGECEEDNDWMVRNCAPSCFACHVFDIDLRCPRHDGVVDAWRAGDLDRVFRRIIDPENGEVARFKPVLHSRPAESSSLGEGGDDVPVGPWVVTFDEFLTHKECDRLVELGYEMGFHRSTETGEREFDGRLQDIETKARTSENTWCGDNCRDEETAKRVMERIANVTGVPRENSEDFQLLKYEVGQYYNVHHDYIYGDENKRCGPRILTFFIYLNDVERGGGTQFPELGGLTVTPKKGMAVLWPSVKSDDPTAVDERTLHAALAVEEGRKYGANAWIHLREYLEQSHDGCC